MFKSLDRVYNVCTCSFRFTVFGELCILRGTESGLNMMVMVKACTFYNVFVYEFMKGMRVYKK